MDLQPTLVGPTITLRPIRPEDYPALYAVASDPGLWALHPAHDRWQEFEFRSYFDKWLIIGGGLAVHENAGGRIVGASCFSLEGRQPREVEIGWTFLAREQRGGTTNREIKRLMIGHAFQYMERAVFRVAESTLRSRRALEKIGAKLTDRTEPIEIGGRPVPHLLYEIQSGAPVVQEAL